MPHVNLFIYLFNRGVKDTPCLVYILLWLGIGRVVASDATWMGSLTWVRRKCMHRRNASIRIIGTEGSTPSPSTGAIHLSISNYFINQCYVALYRVCSNQPPSTVRCEEESEFPNRKISHIYCYLLGGSERRAWKDDLLITV